MSMDPQFGVYLTQTCTIARFASKDKWGNDSYGTAVTFPCRQEIKQHLVINSLGVEQVARSTVYLGISSSSDAGQDITPEDKFTDPDSVVKPILSVDAHPSDSDAQHIALHLG